MSNLNPQQFGPNLPEGYALDVNHEEATELWGLPKVTVTARHEGRQVGMLSVHQRSLDDGVIGHPNIYVDREHQRRGLATAMYAEVHHRWPDVPIQHSEHASEDARALNQTLKGRFGPSHR